MATMENDSTCDIFEWKDVETAILKVGATNQADTLEACLQDMFVSRFFPGKS